jgi:hypothetical protein
VSRNQTIADEGGLAQRHRAAAGPNRRWRDGTGILLAARFTPLQQSSNARLADISHSSASWGWPSDGSRKVSAGSGAYDLPECAC